MEFQIEARRTWDIRNTRCRGCHLKMIYTKGKHIDPLTLLGWGPPAEQ